MIQTILHDFARPVRSHRLLASAAFVALAAAPAPAALAQAAPNPPADAPSTDPAAAPAPSVNEIVVTAQRRAERLKDVPAAISAFTATQLQTLNISSSKQLTEITPGLNFTQSVYSPQPTIRGVGSRGVQAGEESDVPVYIDGVYQSFLPGDDMQFSDVARIEVVKGPQGALLGRNAMGGAINVITKDPTSTPQADASVSYGSYNQVIAKGFVSGGTDKIAGDLAVVENHDDGYIHDIVDGTKYGVTHDFSIRGKLVFHPGETVDLKIAVSHTGDEDSTGEAFRNLDGNTVGAGIPGNIVASAPYTAALSFTPYNNLIQTSVSGTLVVHLGGVDVTAISAYEDADLKIAADADGTPAPLASYFYTQYSHNEYNEVYGTSQGSGPFSWILGGVYYHDLSGNPQLVINLAGVGALQYNDRVGTNSYAGYGQASYKLTDQLTATLAGRYTSETRTIIDSAFGATANGQATFSRFTPSGSLEYKPTGQLNFYAKAGQAFKSGVFNPGLSPAAAAVPVQPETITQYEVGAKIEASPRVSLNLAGYYSKYDNLQSATRTPQGVSLIQNAGSATIYGLEAEAFLRPVDRLNVRLGLSALHGTYSGYADADVYYPTAAVAPPAGNPCSVGSGGLTGGNTEETCNVNGKTIMRTPTVTGNISGDYTIPTSQGDFVLSGNVYHQGVSWWDAANVFEEKPYTLVSARVAWHSPDGHYGVAIWGENLANARYSVTTIVGAFGTSQVLAKPRTAGIELTTHW